jgi:hypothetical protein
MRCSSCRSGLVIARAVLSEAVEVDDALRAVAKVSAKRKPKAAASAALPLSGGLSYSWQGVRVGGTVLTVRLDSALPLARRLDS